MTILEKITYKTVFEKVKYYQDNNFDKYVIIDYIDGMITLMREKISDELLRHLFDIRQNVLLGKKI